LLLACAGDDVDLEVLQAKASRFHHYGAPDLAHLLATLVHPAPEFVDNNTALLVIDSISSLFEAAYSRVQDQPIKKQTETTKWCNSRKYAVMGDLVSRVQKLASVHNLVVLMTQQTRMRVRPGAGAILLPVLSGAEWDNGISTQLVLFRDFPPKTTTQPALDLIERWGRLRYVGVIKVNGVSAEENGRFDTVVPFSIEMV
jgi:RecA/RadA recombinase